MGIDIAAYDVQGPCQAWSGKGGCSPPSKLYYLGSSFGHWSSLVTMIPVNSPSVLAVVQSGGADTTLHILQTLLR